MNSVDKEAELFTRFSDPELEIDPWYCLLAGAAMASKEFRPRLVESLRPELTPLKYTRLYGAILSESSERTKGVLSDELGIIARRGHPLESVIGSVSCLEDYYEMCQVRAAVQEAGKHMCPTLLAETLEAQAALLRKNIRNFQNGD